MGQSHSLDEVGIERGGMRPTMDGIRQVHGNVRTDQSASAWNEVPIHRLPFSSTEDRSG